MKRLQRSLLVQYILVIVIAIVIMPVSTVALSVLFYNTLFIESTPRLYNGTELNEWWQKTAKQLSTVSEEELAEQFHAFREIYPSASFFYVNAQNELRVKYPDTLVLPDEWSASFTVDFMKKNRGNEVDPFTSVALLDGQLANGFIVMQLPRDEMISPSSQLRSKYNFLIPLGLLFIFLVFIFLSFLFFYRIRKRLLQLQKTMETTDEHHIPTPVEVQKEDEIGQLEHSFNRMIETLKRGQLQQQQDEELRKELIATISHDLRTPLTTIRAHAFKLKREALTPAGKESIERIDKKINDLGKLIDHLVSYTLLSAGKYPYHPEPIDIVRLVRTTVAEWYPLFEQKGFTIELNIPDQQMFWEVDAQWFNRMMDNFFQNIVRHAQDGYYVGVTIQQNRICIIDHGPGMRHHSAHRGAGVGLSIIALMTEQMNIDWQIETSAHGTTMCLQQKTALH